MPSYTSTLEEIKNRVDIVELISEYVSLKRTGQNFKALCPFHSEKTPSFIVSPSKQIYHCFGCGEGGDIFTFLVRHEGLSFKEAVRELAGRAGVELRGYQEERPEAQQKRPLLNLNKDALAFFQKVLTKSQKAMNYLKERGIDRRGQELFSIGYAPKTWNSLMSYLEGRGHKAELIKKAGLITVGTKGYYDVFRDRIIFPIFDLKGDVVAFGGRVLDDSEPKYLNSPETPLFNKRKILYGLNLAKGYIKKRGYVLLMEGYLDVITAHLYGFSNSVAPLGTALTEEHGRLIKRFTDEVILVFDSDQAGVRAARNAVSVLFSTGVNVRMLCLSEDEDPDSFLRKNGADAFESLLKTPLSIVDFLIQYGGDRRIIARETIEVLSKIPDSILQGSYVKLLSERLGINEFFIIEELKRMRRRSGRVVADSAPVESSRPRPLDEIYLLKLLLQIPERAEDILKLVSSEDFEDRITRSIFSKIKQGLIDTDKLLLECEEEEKRLLTRIMLMVDFEEPEKVLRDCLKRVVAKRRRAMLEDIQVQIKDAELKGDSDRLRSLQMKQSELLSEMSERAGGIKDERVS